jgi:hypothetical protein
LTLSDDLQCVNSSQSIKLIKASPFGQKKKKEIFAHKEID